MIKKENSEKILKLKEYCEKIKNDNIDRRKLYDEYKIYTEDIKPQEAFEVFHSLLEKGYKAGEILEFLDRIINVFYEGLSNYNWEKPKNEEFLRDLLNENKALEEKIDEIKSIIREKDLKIKKDKLIPKVEELKKFDDHYLKKENILFPYMENKMEKFHGLSIMWELHDDVRNTIEETIIVLKDPKTGEGELSQAIGDLIFGLLGLKLKEELILFPAATEVLEEDIWIQMYKQSLEYEFPFIERPKDKIEEDNLIEILEEGRFRTETGELSFEEILMIFNALPIDLTFVDENDKVRYFTKPKDRLFPRSPAVIGRDVNNCHPPASVHIVEEIVEEFKNGKKDFAQFWINLKGRRILIQYYVLRDFKGNYRGVLEVSQDITEIQKLEGERRLLEWEDNKA